MSSPKKRTRPAVGGKSPVMALNSVVLPAPLAPSTARRSPAATENETSSIARSAPKARRHALEHEGVSRHSQPCFAAGSSAVAGAAAKCLEAIVASRLAYLRQSGTSRAAEAHLLELGLRQAERLR